MFILLGVAILISSLVARIQANLEHVQEREREAVQLYELSVELAGTNDPAVIARTLAQRLAGLFQSSVVEVAVGSPGAAAIIERASSGDAGAAPGGGKAKTCPA